MVCVRNAAKVLLALALLLAGLPVGRVSAHANLVRSNPAAGQVLARAPEQVELVFSEAVDPRFTRVRVLDAQNQVVAEGELLEEDPAGKLVAARLPELPDGVYSLSWVVRSSVDGHSTRGVVSFSIGRAGPRASLLPPPGQPLPTQALPNPLDVALRGLNYLSMGLSLGLALFALLVWRPVYRGGADEGAEDAGAQGGTGSSDLDEERVLVVSRDFSGGSAVPPAGEPAGYRDGEDPVQLRIANPPAGDPFKAPAPDGIAAAPGQDAAPVAVYSAALKPAFDAWFTGRLRLLMRVGLVGLAAAAVGLVLLQAAQTAGPGEPFGLRLVQLLDLHSGWAFWARAFLIGLLALYTRGLPPVGEGSARPWWESAVMGAALLLTYSLGGHNAALGRALPVAADWLHLLAMSGWVGGLAALALILARAQRGGLPRRALHLGALLGRFSRLAELWVILLAVTGIYAASLHVRTLEALTGTRYGQALAVKLVLFGLLVGLGAVNMLGLVPRVAMAGRRALYWLARTVRVELAVLGLVLLAAGFLLSISPAYDALQAQNRLGTFQRWQEGRVRVALGIAPARAGENEIAAEIQDRRPGVESAAPQVLFRFNPVDDPMAVTQAEAAPVEGAPGTSGSLNGARNGDRYSVRGSYLASAGPWQVEVILRRPGFDDVRHRFRVEVGSPQAGALYPINPSPPDLGSIIHGQALYQESCLPCHGASGKGDGPAGIGLNPRPVDLTQHMLPGKHSDGEVFYWITEGVEGSAMPPFKDVLDETERWHVINYIRTLAE